MIAREPRGQELIDRYKSVYHLSDEVEISEEMILAHWELEKKLAKQLLESTPENRWKTFDRCYTKLYSELHWLNKVIGSFGADQTPDDLYSPWTFIIGDPPKTIYEVGSGKGALISYLAAHGYTCKGTEITCERGEKHVSEFLNLEWGRSDGVHLNRFENDDTYDVVLSSQVIEHIHPDDLVDHFNAVKSILIQGGRYIITTPHKFAGPSDISKVFKEDMVMGMHLKEYTYNEMRELLRRSGFNKISAVCRIPPKISRLLGITFKLRPSCLYFSYLCMVEKFISLLPVNSRRRKIVFLLRFILFDPFTFVIAHN